MGQEYWEGHVAKWSSGHSAISENTKRDLFYIEEVKRRQCLIHGKSDFVLLLSVK